MRFIQKIIDTKKTHVLMDIWVYKIRVAVLEISRTSSTIIAYAEKKQEPDDFEHGKITNFENVSQNIAYLMQKVYNDAKIESALVHVNTSIYESYFTVQRYHLKRQSWKPIKKYELKDIGQQLLQQTQTKDSPVLEWVFWTKNLKLILSNLKNISLDWQISKNILEQDPKNIDITLSQFYMQHTAYDRIKKLIWASGEKLQLVLPHANSLKDLINARTTDTNYITIHIQNRQTLISYITNSELYATATFSIGIDELLYKLTKKYKITYNKAIKTIDQQWLYSQEKQEFYRIWQQALIIQLEDIIWNTIWPHTWYIFGGWYNYFIEQHIAMLNLHSTSIKVWKKLIIKNISNIDKNFIDWKYQIDVKANLELLSMIVSLKKYYDSAQNETIAILQKLLKN